MSKNLIPEICKLLGVELGEKFKLDIRGDNIFQITESGIWMRKGVDKDEWVETPFEFMMLCNGDAEIIRLPWKPKVYDTYWTFSAAHINVWCITDSRWTGSPYDVAALKAGWVYSSMEEAKAALPTVATKVGVRCKE